MSAIAARRARLLAEESTSTLPVAGETPEQPGEASSTPDKTSDLQVKRKSDHSSSVDSLDQAAYAKRRTTRRTKLESAEGSSESDRDQSESQTNGAENGSSGHEAAIASSGQAAFIPRRTGPLKNLEIVDRGNNDVKGKRREDADVIVVALQPNETLYLAGAGTIKVLDGTVALDGAILTSSSPDAWVIAPIHAPVPTLQASSVEHIHQSTAERFGFADQAFTAVVQLTVDRTSNVQRMHSVCPAISPDAFHINPPDPSQWPTPSFGPALASKSLASTSIFPSWANALRRAEECFAQDRQMTCLVRGPKRVGKSTFCKLILQRLLTSSSTSGAVAFLETDVGQSEYGLPGTVSLHTFSTSSPVVFGPSWATVRHPVKSHFLGHLSPKSNPAAYLRAIGDLIDTYRRDWQCNDVPLVVNTQGWVKGLGADLLAQLEKMTRSAYIFDVSDEAPSVSVGMPNAPLSLDDHCQSDHEAIVVPLEAAPAILTRERGLNANEARSMNLLSYFYAERLPRSQSNITQNGNTSEPLLADQTPKWNFSSALVTRTPFDVDVRTGLQGGIIVSDDVCKVNDCWKLAALNGACVALVLQRAGEDGHMVNNDNIWIDAFRKRAPEPLNSVCMGLAIVRSIDTNAATVRLLSPLDPALIRLSRQALGLGSSGDGGGEVAIVKAEFDFPTWLSLDSAVLDAVRSNNFSLGDPTHLLGVRLKDVPYLDFGSEAEENAVGMGKRRIRRNLLRPSQRAPNC